MTALIAAEALTKYYGRHRGVQSLTFAVDEGTVFHDAIDIATHEPSLEEVFLHFYINEPRRDTQPAAAVEHGAEESARRNGMRRKCR